MVMKLDIKVEGQKIGNHTVCEIYQLDKDTVLLSFDGEWDNGENDDCIVTQVEYHKDEDK